MAQAPGAPADDTHLRAIETYCGECHNSTDWAGGVAFDTYAPEDVPDEIDVWESVVVKLRGHLMPPPGSKQPTQAEKDDLVGWLETRLDARPATPRAGYVTAQRLNRTEYANAIRSLLGVEIKVEDLLPPEIEMEGFDNIAAVLTVSPSFLDQYISAARFISRRAVGNPKPSMGKSLYQPSGGTPTDMPLGSAGGFKFRHFFPADGEYRLSILSDLTGGLYTHPSLFRRTVVILLDGKEIFRADIGGKDDLGLADKEAQPGRDKVMARFRDIPFKATSGEHEVIVTSMQRAQVLSDENIGAGGGPGGAGGGLDLRTGVEVSGPYGETSISRSPSRDRIFVCYPAAEAEERACAEKIARNLATRAYRRPVTDADVSRLMNFYEAGRREIGHFDGGVQEIVMGAISSPDFLYRVIAPREQPAQREQPLSDLELASRLSFFLWSDVPDDELLQLAVAGKLKDKAVYDAQVARMLRDRRAMALIDGFAMRWLNVDDLKAVEPDTNIYRFNEGLRTAFSTEIRLFLADVLLENRSILDLLNADYTFLNSTLASHYGIKGIRGTQFRKVQLTDPARFGLLGKAAVLLRTSYGDRTSPVLRGAWILERILGTPATPPPPGVETNLAAKEGEHATTLRGRLEEHRAVQSCNQCHGVIDPLGLALENFDVVGAWRTREADSRLPVDASTVLPDGRAVNGVVELREALLQRPEQFAWAMTQKLLMYATGREVEASDMPQVRSIVRDAAGNGYRFFDLVNGVVHSDAFRLQGPPHHEQDGPGTSVASNHPAR